jgi:hypothetical protein
MNTTASGLPSRPSYFSSTHRTPAQSPAQISPTVLLLLDANSKFPLISHQAKLLRSLPHPAQSNLTLVSFPNVSVLATKFIAFCPRAALLALQTCQFMTLQSPHTQYRQHRLCPPSYPFGFKTQRCQQTDVRLHMPLVCYCFPPQHILQTPACSFSNMPQQETRFGLIIIPS